MRRLNYNQLFYFYVVATEGSVKAACKKLHLSQPTISGQLRTLEDDMGVRLFHRRYRKLELNESGKEVLKRAEKIFFLGEELVHNLPCQNGLRQEIRIGAVPTLSNAFLQKFTASMWKNKSLTTHVERAVLERLIDKLERDAIDIVLADSDQYSSSKHQVFNLGQEKLVAVASSDFGKGKSFPDNLRGKPYVSLTRDGILQRKIKQYFEVNNIQPRYLGSVDELSLLLELVENGICFSVLSETAVNKNLQAERMMCLGELEQVGLNPCAVLSASGVDKIYIRKVINYFLVENFRT